MGMSGRPVTIRTLDVGADKADRTGLALRGRAEPRAGPARRAPVAGAPRRCSRRSCARSCARRATAACACWCRWSPRRGDASRCARELARVAATLRAEGHEVADDVPLGAMIEVPAAALALPAFIARASISSRSARTTWCSTCSPSTATTKASGDLYTPLHPAVMRLLRDTIRLRAAPRRAGRGLRRDGRRRRDSRTAAARTRARPISACTRARCWKCAARSATATTRPCARGCAGIAARAAIVPASNAGCAAANRLTPDARLSIAGAQRR